MTTLRDRRIVITGPTSQVALPVTLALAADNQVHALARFSSKKRRAQLEAAGVQCIEVDLARGALEEVPKDVDYLLNFAVVRTGNFDCDVQDNVAIALRLMAHCAGARAMLHCSSGGVYEYAGATALTETAPLGDSHRAMLPTYSISKIATEAAVRVAARQHGLPTTIARMGVPYGDSGGWPFYHLLAMQAGQPVPLHPDRPNLFSPIHEDDYIAQLPALLEVASVDASVLNWAGPDAVSVEAWCQHMGSLTGLEPRFVETDQTIGSVNLDTTALSERVGTCQVDWREGMRRMIAARRPELLR